MKRWNELRYQKNDISEHLGLLRGLAMGCKQVVELGLRNGNSAMAMLDGTDCCLHSFDINPCTETVKELTAIFGRGFKFTQGNSMEVDIPECDMILIDTKHDYTVLKVELERHQAKVRKLIVMHDTEKFKVKGESAGDPGLRRAIEEFLDTYGPLFLPDEWEELLHLPNQNGLTILGREM